MDTFQVREFADGSIDGFRSQTPVVMCPHYRRVETILAETLGEALHRFRDRKIDPPSPAHP